jgi:hypothetical protein
LDAWWVTLLRRQQSDCFVQIAGTTASLTLPISDRLISEIVAHHIPSSVPIQSIDIVAHAGNELTVQIRLTKPAFLPAVRVRLAIQQQPSLPSSPSLSLAIVSQGLASLAASALRFVDVLPPGMKFDGRRFLINLAIVLERQGAAELLEYFTDLTITTADRRFIIQARGGVPGPFSAATADERNR